MKALRVFLLRAAGLFFRRDRDLNDEIEANLQLQIDDYMRQGMSVQESRRHALIKLGGIESTKESYRDRATLPFIENLIRDIRYALRQLRKNPGFTATAVLLLTLGIGASVAIFAFVDAALIKPLPYKDSKRLVGVYEKIENACPRCNLSYLDYLDWKRLNKVFHSFDAYNHQGLMLTTPSGAQPAFCTRVTDGFFQTLGVTPILGRDFRRGEDLLASPRTVILSYSVWQKQYGGKPDVLGKTVILNDAPHLVIGVLPREFHFAPAAPTEYWVTLHASSECDLRRSCHNLYGVARLSDGVTLQAALADVTGIAKRLEKEYPGSNRDQGANLAPLSQVILGDIQPILLVLLGSVFLLLLIAAVNAASLLLVRTEARMRELAIRSGLGASRARILGQFAAEGIVLVLMGTVVGLFSAYGTVQILSKLLSADMLLRMPYLDGLGLNARVLAFGGLTAFLAALLFSFTPAVSLSLSEMRQGLAEGSRGSSRNTWRRLGSKLVVVELATAVVLLAGAGLLGQSLYRLLAVNLGMRPDHLVLINVALPPKGFSTDPQIIAAERQVIARISALPGVRSVGIASKPPVSFRGNTTWFKIIGRPWHGEHNDTPFVDVTAGYFQTVGAALLKGRYFTEDEDASKPLVAIVNRSFVRQYFPNENPVGKHLSPLSDPPKPIEIVGLVEDIKEGPLDNDNGPTIYFPFTQNNETFFCVFARTAGVESPLLPAISQTIRKINPAILTMQGETMSEQIDQSQAVYLHRSLAWLVGGFAAMALLLGVVGLYGVIAYSVGQRTREIGVRIALGAERSTVYKLILKEAGSLIVAGIALGVVCSIPAAGLMRNLLYGVTSWDPATIAGVVGVLGSAAILASFIPARRAASVNPVEALRAE